MFIGWFSFSIPLSIKRKNFFLLTHGQNEFKLTYGVDVSTRTRPDDVSSLFHRVRPPPRRGGVECPERGVCALGPGSNVDVTLTGPDSVSETRSLSRGER